MFDDVVSFSILALGALVGSLLFPARPREARGLLTRLRRHHGSIRDLWRHPYLRLAMLGTLLALLSWAGLVARVGLSEAGTLATRGVLTTPGEAAVCHDRQRRLAEFLETERPSQTLLPSQGELRLIPIRCPSGGEYSFDEERSLSCNVHGPSRPAAVLRKTP